MMACVAVPDRIITKDAATTQDNLTWLDLPM
jgi:hypothetical protein